MFRKLCVSAAALLAASLCMGGSAHAASDPKTGSETDQLQAVVQPSIVYETITWKGFVWDIDNKKYIGKGGNAKQFTAKMQCTGYVVNPDGWVATAGHCVDTRDGKKAIIETAAQWAVANGFYVFGTTVESLVKNQHYRVNTFDDDDKLHRNTVDRTVVASWGAAVSGVEIAKSKPAFVRAFRKHEDGDAALLKVDETDLNAIKLGDSKDVSINDDVVAIGYPAIIDSYTDADLTPTFDPGTITSRKTVADGLLPVLQMSAQLSGGMSGGPTVTPDGTVIGTNVSHFPGEPFNYAIPIEQITELMNSTGVDNTLSSTTQKYRDGVSAYYAKDRTKAVKNLQAVVDEQPGNGFASDLLKKSKDLPKPKPKDTGSNALLFIGLGVLLLLLIIGGVVALLLTRRNKGPKPMTGQAAAPGGPGGPGGPGMVPGPASGPASPYAAPAPGGPVAPTGAPAGPGAYPTGAPTGPGAYPTSAPTGAPTSAPTGAPTGYPTTSPPSGDVPASQPTAPVGADTGSAPQGGLVPPAPLSPNGRGESGAPGESAGAERTAPFTSTTAVSEGEAVGHHFCSNCGAKATEGTKFCGECGTHL